MLKQLINIIKLIIIALGISLYGFAQTGNFLINNFSPVNYNANQQNWGSTQHRSGHVFFANNNGVLFFDGKEWRLTVLPNTARVLSIANNETAIYIGAERDFGYQEKTPSGDFRFVSLKNKLKEDDKNFTYIWATKIIGNKIYFCSAEKIFIYDGDTIEVISSESSSFHTFLTIGKHLFVREWGVGLNVIVNGKKTFVKGTEHLSEIRVYGALETTKNNYLLVSRNGGVFKLNYNENKPENSTLEKYKSSIDEWLKTSEFYCAEKLTNNCFALGSLKKGLIITDQNLNIVKQLNSTNGLQDDGVLGINTDINDNLWLSLSSGVSFVEYNSPITVWGKSNKIFGTIEATIKYKNAIYIATNKGYQSLNILTNQFSEPKLNESYDFAICNDKLILANADGLFDISGNEPKLLAEMHVYRLFYDTATDLLYVGREGGLTIGKYDGKNFTEIKNIDHVGDVRTIAKSKDDLIAFSTWDKGIYLFKQHNYNNITNVTLKDGLPSMVQNHLFTYNGELYLGGDSGFYKLNANGKCKPYLKFNFEKEGYIFTQIFSASQIDHSIWYSLTKSKSGNSKNDELGYYNPTDDQSQYLMLKRIKNVLAYSFYKVDSLVYISTNNGLISYNTTIKPKISRFNTYISELIYNKNDTIRNIDPNSIIKPIEMLYKSDGMQITLGAADYFDKNEIEFSYFIEGKDDEYNQWSVKNNYININNLHEGTYTLHVKSRNILGIEGNEIKINFTVLPPWYRTIAAYAMYVIVLIVLISVTVRIYTNRLRLKNIKLENLVTERTKTIASQKEEIEHKTKEITDSINYAKRIQEAILPPIVEIKNYWSDLFIFYQPKDIVSGDFYWFNKINDNEFLIACADCTGHGVPGGFMSMICSDKLNEAVKLSIEPGLMLKHVNNAVKESLRHKVDATTNDGMEISLVKINTNSGEMIYAGANRSLWIARKGANEIEDIKPNKASIASTTIFDYEYNQHLIKINKGDMIYMSSDGYPDQFGGKEGKKFMTKNFKQFLVSIQKLPVEEQKMAINANIMNWMNGYDQVDDLLVIGIKL